MELRQLRHFVALAEHMHFGRAARQLCITQSALSASIARLEESIELRLFERDSKGVSITLAGQLMLRSAREMLGQATRTESFSRSLAAGKAGWIQVGFSGAVLHRGCDRVILDCRRDFPDVEIAMREMRSQEQIDLIRAGKLDAGFVTYPFPPSGLMHVELYKDRFVLCLPTRHRLSRLPAIDISLLHGESFVLPAHDRTPSMHDQLIGLCATAGFYPKIAFQADSPISTLHLVARGLGISFVVESLKQFKIPGIQFVPLAEHMPGRSTFFIWDGERIAPGLDTLITGLKRFAADRPWDQKQGR